MMNNILLSLPPRVASASGLLKSMYGKENRICYADSDPEDYKLGSGGGTVWLADRFAAVHPEASGRNIIIHAGGQSRRLPAYAATGKSLTPLPVLRWAVGDAVDQTLLDMQLPLLDRIVDAAPRCMTTLVASGDVLVRDNGPLPAIPEADVVCFGLWTEPSQACNHGVFFMRRGQDRSVEELDFMLQKPSVDELSSIGRSHFYLMDIGLWLLSDRAMDVLRRKSSDIEGNYRYYDLYSEFGCGLGASPSAPDRELASLSVAIVPLPYGEFYHFGTTRQLLSSTLRLQNLVADQRKILQRTTKPNPALFVQNCVMGVRLGNENDNVWVENSHVAESWNLTTENVITGVPGNDWRLDMPSGSCLDIVPVDEDAYAVRAYGYDDAMRGDINDITTEFLGRPLMKWAEERGVIIPGHGDIQQAMLFPLVRSVAEMGLLVRWMISEPDLEEGRKLWLSSVKLSADMIMKRVNLRRLYNQRRQFLKIDLPLLASNPVSVLYQLDLEDVAAKYVEFGLDKPDGLPADAPVSRRLHNHMLRSRIDMFGGSGDGESDSAKAFGLMRDTILESAETLRMAPRLSVESDQIVWGRSPVRIDLAGGWTDTPPYSLLHGGAVVNMAVELNGQPPLQVFIKPCAEPHIILRSIDLGASEVIADYASLTDYARVGSPFSLPKAALSIAGFAPQFSLNRFISLEQQLKAFGAGMEMTMLSALPAGSGMGTSSILAATALGALSDFCGLGWTSDEICERTLAVEQMLTTGGGWQDQYGGVLQGVKLLQTADGWRQSPSVSWLPEGVFTDACHAPCHLLYYTGITRTAKGILAEIVKRMFLNHGDSLRLLHHMKEHAQEVAEAIQRREFTRFGALVGKSWQQNQLLDSGTCPAAVRRIIDMVEDYTLGVKLPGAGGGGYLYMVAKDPEAASIIRSRLSGTGCGRFADISISDRGLQVSRS